MDEKEERDKGEEVKIGTGLEGGGERDGGEREGGRGEGEREREKHLQHWAMMTEN